MCHEMSVCVISIINTDILVIFCDTDEKFKYFNKNKTNKTLCWNKKNNI